MHQHSIAFSIATYTERCLPDGNHREPGQTQPSAVGPVAAGSSACTTRFVRMATDAVGCRLHKTAAVSAAAHHRPWRHLTDLT